MFKFIKFLYKFSDTGFTNTVTVKVVHVINKKKRKSFFTLTRARLVASFQCELEKV